MFKTISCESSREEIFVLNPISKFLVKNFPKEQEGKLLVGDWVDYFIDRFLSGDIIELDRIMVSVPPEELYFLPNTSISNSFNKWLEMFKNGTQPECIILDSIPGNSESLSMEVKGVPEESIPVFKVVLDKINTGAMISRNEIEKAIENHHE